MSREYVERRLRESAFRFDRDEAVVMWSLTAGRYMLCDLKNGTCEELTEQPAVSAGGSR